MRPDATPIADRQTEGSTLCLACGLCCNGVLHDKVDVQHEDVQLVRKLGLTVETFEERAVGFRQPCVLYRQERCSVHPHHPPTCQTYQCALLRKYEGGDVTLERSLAIVVEAKELLTGGADSRQDYSEKSRRRVLAQSWDGKDGLLGSGALRQANAALALRAVTLDVLLEKHFRRPAIDNPTS